MKSIYLYPELRSESDLNNILSRLAWYFGPHLHKLDKIYLSCKNLEMLQSVQVGPNLDPKIEAMLPALVAKTSFHTRDGLNFMISDADPAADVLLIWDLEAEAQAPAPIKTKISALAANSGVYRVDPIKTRQEGSFYLWCGLNKFCDYDAVLAHNVRKFNNLVDDLKGYENSYVFGTGPTFSDYVESRDFSDSLCIAANSIVKNTEALERLNPKIICAADPIYHAGCSSYAGAFRDSLVSAMRSTGAWFLCPLRDLAIYQNLLPEFKEKIIGVPFDREKPIPVNLADDFYTRPYPNVLTLMLLPIASSLTNNIHIVGCDGRKLLNDSFFWSHDKKVQFNDKMSEIQAAHPGFFNIDYNDYYTEHCKDLENVLSALESAGKTILTETPSLIPALHAREKTASISLEGKYLGPLVILDPDAKDDWGHFLAYDKRLAEAAQQQGISFALVGRQELDDRYQPPNTSAFLRTFSVHSWTVGNKSPAKQEDVIQWARELDASMCELEAKFPDGTLCLFFYVGSLEVVEVLEFLLIEHPRFVAVINLFWSYNFDQNNSAYKARWLPVINRARKNPRLALTHSTQQISTEFALDWGISLPVLEHPSTTFSDKESRTLISKPVAPKKTSDNQRFRVVFPGGARLEKGFKLAVEAVDMLRNQRNVQPVLRSRLDKVSGTDLHTTFANLNKTGIEIVDQDLSDSEFIALISNADIVVIPYLSEAFRRRTSGILVDAMLLQKPVIVLENTWLADNVSKYKTGVSVAPSGSAIKAGVLDVIQNYDTYLSHIDAARQSYLETNSWCALLQKISLLSNLEIGSKMNSKTDGQCSLLDSDTPNMTPSLLLSACTTLLLTAPAQTLEALDRGEGLAKAIQSALQDVSVDDRSKSHHEKVLGFVRKKYGQHIQQN